MAINLPVFEATWCVTFIGRPALCMLAISSLFWHPLQSINDLRFIMNYLEGVLLFLSNGAARSKQTICSPVHIWRTNLWLSA